MLLPLVASVLASVKPTSEAAESPPTLIPHGFSLDAYRRLWEYEAGLPTYLANSFGTAVLTVLFTLILTTLAGYGLARFPVPVKEPLFVLLLLALIIPYQALITPIFLMFSDLGLTNSLVGLAIIHTRDRAAVRPVHHAQQPRGDESSEEAAKIIDGASSAQIPRGSSCPPECRPSSCSSFRLHHVQERSPWQAWDLRTPTPSFDLR